MLSSSRATPTPSAASLINIPYNIRKRPRPPPNTPDPSLMQNLQSGMKFPFEPCVALSATHADTLPLMMPRTDSDGWDRCCRLSEEGKHLDHAKDHHEFSVDLLAWSIQYMLIHNALNAT